MNKWIVMFLIVGVSSGFAFSQTADNLTTPTKVAGGDAKALTTQPSDHKDMITWPCPKEPPSS
jgi:hypothetical protein